MSLSPAKFKNIATKLIGPKGAFKAFRADCVITKRGDFSFENQTATKNTKTIKMINLKFLQQTKDSKPVDENMISLIAVYEELPFELSVDDTSFVFENVSYSFKSLEIDPAKATIILHGVA